MSYLDKFMARIINLEKFKLKKELKDCTALGDGLLELRVLNNHKKTEQILNLLNLNDIYYETRDVRELGESFTKITVYEIPPIAYSRLIDIYID